MLSVSRRPAWLGALSRRTATVCRTYSVYMVSRATKSARHHPRAPCCAADTVAASPVAMAFTSRWVNSQALARSCGAARHLFAGVHCTTVPIALSHGPAKLASPRRQWLCSDGAGPDPSRGFDVTAYNGLWHNLSREAWPNEQTLAVIGPVDTAFTELVKACSNETAGCEITSVSTTLKSRLQSVKLRVRCMTPDDFCALHSRLSALDNVKAIV